MKLLLISCGFMMQRAYQWKAVELSKLCDAVEVIIPSVWKELWSDEAITPDEGPLDGIRHHHLPFLFPFSKHYAIMPPRRFARILERFRPDVIDYDNEPFNLGSAQVVAMAQRSRPQARVFLHAAQNLLKWYPPPFSWIEQYVFARCGGAFARNNEARRVLIERGLDAEKITVMGHGVSVHEFKKPRQRQEQGAPLPGAVLYIGALTHQKGVDTLLRACAIAHQFRTLTIVGDGPELTRLQELAKDLKIDDRTRFMGRLSHLELKELYGTHACLVLPSRTTPRLVEQFGRVLLEAMAAGCPVIASSSGNIPKVVGSAGMIFKEDRIEELADALNHLLGDPEHRAELRERGLERVRTEYEWSIIARRMIAAFRREAVRCWGMSCESEDLI